MRQEMVDAFRRSALFSSLGEADALALALRAVPRRLVRGEVLFVAGEPAHGLYIVVQGAVCAVREGPQGREQCVYHEGAGGTLAEVPMLDGGPYLSTAVASQDTLVLFLENQLVRQLCRERPAVAWGALQLLSGRVRWLAELVDVLVLHEVDQRLAWYLTREASDHGRAVGTGIAFDLTQTHEQIASHIGSVREVVSRAFLELQGQHLVQMSRRVVTVPSLEALNRYAICHKYRLQAGTRPLSCPL